MIAQLKQMCLSGIYFCGFQIVRNVQLITFTQTEIMFCTILHCLINKSNDNNNSFMVVQIHKIIILITAKLNTV